MMMMMMMKLKKKRVCRYIEFKFKREIIKCPVHLLIDDFFFYKQQQRHKNLR